MWLIVGPPNGKEQESSHGVHSLGNAQFAWKAAEAQMHWPHKAKSAEQVYTWRPVQFCQCEGRGCRMWRFSSWGLGSSETPSPPALAPPLLKPSARMGEESEFPGASVYLSVKWKT